MLQLYTVILKHENSITRYDAKGKPIVTREVVEVKICDLPLQTAQMYRNTDKSTHGVTIIKQEAIQQSRSDQNRPVATRQSARPAQKKAAPPVHQINQAASTGNMAAALNTRS